MKRCCRCGVEKSRSDFSARKSGSSDGLLSFCKDCDRARNKARRAVNKDKIRKYAAEYRAKNKESIRARVVAYREANPEIVKGYYSKYRAAHREERNERQRERTRAIPEVIRRRNAAAAPARKARTAEQNLKMNAKNAITCAAADHSGLTWTLGEDSIVLRSDLSTIEKVFMLRRSLYAVQRRSYLLGLSDHPLAINHNVGATA